MAMVTARARVPAMACVGGPAAGRGARRRRDLLRSSASRGAVTWKPLQPVEKFGNAVRRSLKRPLLCSQIWDDRLAHGLAHGYRVARALFSRGRLISEASLPVFQRGWGRIPCFPVCRLQDTPSQIPVSEFPSFQGPSVGPRLRPCYSQRSRFRDSSRFQDRLCSMLTAHVPIFTCASPSPSWVCSAHLRQALRGARSAASLAAPRAAQCA